MEHSTFSFFKKLSNDNFCLVYSGNIIDEVTDKIIDLSEYNFEYHDDNKSSKRKISFLLAECFQNVIRHSEIPETGFHENRNFGFFLTRNMQGVNFITSGNLVKKDNIEILKTQLNQVNSLDQDGLKELYFNVITNRSFSNKGGAGLGLIEMARKSGEKIEYIFDEFDSEYSVFYSQVMLKAPKQILKHTGYHIVEAIEFHKLMRSENILMIQKGDFSNSSIFPA